VTDELYLSPQRSGVPWLLDPASSRVAELARALKERTPETPCVADAVATDLAQLPELLRQRHFGVATGLIGVDKVAEAERLIAAAESRVRDSQPTTWGAALGDLSDALRITLRDRHVLLLGSVESRIRAEEAAANVEDDAPAVETTDVDGVLCIRLRRFWGGAEDDRQLWAWSALSREHFHHQRIIIDLRGNTGGNDAVMWEWMLPAVLPGTKVPGTATGWYVGETPLGIWNSAALIEARDGRDAVPTWHLRNRHRPTPQDELIVRAEDGDEAVPPGDAPWHGRMLVLVDAGTRSSGESSAWMLRHGLRARVIGQPTAGMIEYGNNVPYLFPASGLHIAMPTKRNDFGMPVELVGFPVDANLDPATPIVEVARDFDRLYSGGP